MPNVVKFYFRMNLQSNSFVQEKVISVDPRENNMMKSITETMKHPPSAIVWGAILIRAIAGSFFKAKSRNEWAEVLELNEAEATTTRVGE